MSDNKMRIGKEKRTTKRKNNTILMKNKFDGVTGLITAFTLSVSLLSGCSLTKPTTESLLKSYAKQMGSLKTMEMDMELTFDVDISKQNMTVTMEIGGGSDIQYVKENEDNYKGYMDTDISVSMFGVSREVETESYVTGDPSGAAMYTKSKDSEKWSKTDGSGFLLPNADLSALAQTLSLQEDTVIEDGRECYVLSGSVTGEDLPIEQSKFGLDLDLKDVKMYESLKLDKNDKTPVSLTITADEDSLNKLLQDSVGELIDDAEVTIRTFEMIWKIKSIDKELTVDIPDEVYDAVESDSEGILDSFGTSEAE
ncbi:MAG: hypothetical protein IJ711_03980 [Lachnospiraceae bacterium]|nr:hypothetical protein [Lachnospiraceae bacterium]